MASASIIPSISNCYTRIILMANKAPGKHYRKGISIFDAVLEMFPDDETAMGWFEKCVWKKNGGEPICPKCGSIRISKGQKHPSFPYRCKDCRKCFSVRTSTQP